MKKEAKWNSSLFCMELCVAKKTALIGFEGAIFQFPHRLESKSIYMNAVWFILLQCSDRILHISRGVTCTHSLIKCSSLDRDAVHHRLLVALSPTLLGYHNRFHIVCAHTKHVNKYLSSRAWGCRAETARVLSEKYSVSIDEEKAHTFNRIEMNARRWKKRWWGNHIYFFARFQCSFDAMHSDKTLNMLSIYTCSDVFAISQYC